MAKRKSPQHKTSETRKIVEYMISGGAYFWTGYLVFFAGDKVFHLSLWWAKLAANIVGWIVNYLLQRYWVFQNDKLKNHQTQVTTRYAVITLADFVIDYYIVKSLKTIGITPYLGQFASAGFFTVWNYLWYRFWVFPDKFSRKKPATVTPARLLAHRAHGPSAYHLNK